MPQYRTTRRGAGSWQTISLAGRRSRGVLPVGLGGLTAILFCLPGPVICAAEVSQASPTNYFEKSFEDLLAVNVDEVQAASRYVQHTSDAPSSVSVVNQDEIRRFGWRTLAELLRAQRGFYVTYDRTYSFLGVRGFGRPGDYNGRVLLMVDGHRINENVYDSAVIGTEFPLDLELVDRVEIIRGPGAALYGNNAFFAVVNVITRPGSQFQGSEVSGEVASGETFKGTYSYGRRVSEDLDFLISGSIYESAGQDSLYFPEMDDPATRNGLAQDADSDRVYKGFARLRWKQFTLTGLYGWREKTSPTAPYGAVFGDPRSDLVDERYYLDLQYETTFGECWGLAGRAYYDVYDYEGQFPYDDPAVPGSTYFNHDAALGTWAGTEWTVSRSIADRHRFLAGVEYRRNIDQAQRNYDDPDIVYFDSNYGSDVVGVYALGELSLRTNLVLNAGIRYDYVSDFGGSWNPRAALIYNPEPDATLKLIYGTAFRAPNVFEARFGGPGLGYVPDPSLAPETITTYEFVHEQVLPWDLRWTSSLFAYEIEGLVSQVYDPVTDLVSYRNASDTLAHGIELGLEKRWKTGALARVAYSVQEAKDAETGAPLSNCPRHLVQFHLMAPLLGERLTPAVEVLYVADVLDEIGQPVDDYVLVNLTISSRRLVKGLEVSASVYNLFDADYVHPVSTEHAMVQVPQDGRSFRFKLSYRF